MRILETSVAVGKALVLGLLFASSHHLAAQLQTQASLGIWRGPVFASVTGSSLDSITVNANGEIVVHRNDHGRFDESSILSRSGLRSVSHVAVGDFNRDGNVDLVVSEASNNRVAVLLGNGDGTFGAPRVFTFGTHDTVTSIVVAHFTSGVDDDIAFSTSAGIYLIKNQGGTLTSPVLLAAMTGNCPPPAQAGVHVCMPFPNTSNINSPVQVIASGTGASGQVNHMELWADGHKLGQSPGSLFDAPVRLQSGSHQVTAVEVDSRGAFLKSSSVSVTVTFDNSGQTCSLPSSPGVHVCSPVPNMCTTSGYTSVVASGKGASGTVNHMELWVGNLKIADFPGNHFNTNLRVSDFGTVTVIEVDSKGAFIKAAPITVHLC